MDKHRINITQITNQNLTLNNIMFFVSQPEYCRRQGPVSPLNELCLLNNLQREVAYRQYQQEKKQIQKLNQPDVKLSQDLENYYIVLNKNVNRSNYQFMNKFDGYSLKQVDSNSLIVRSARDNFYKNFSLPSNIDASADIKYVMLNNGYKLVISIPKKRSFQLKTSQFGLPDILNSLNLSDDILIKLDNKEGMRTNNDEGKINDKSANNESAHTNSNNKNAAIRRIPIMNDNEDNFSADDQLIPTIRKPSNKDASDGLHRCQDGRDGGEPHQTQDRDQKVEKTREETGKIKEGKEGRSQRKSETEGIYQSSRLSRQNSTSGDELNSDVVSNKSNELINNKHSGNDRTSEKRKGKAFEEINSDFMKNYKTLDRKTVFLPNTLVDNGDQMDVDEPENVHSVPIKRTKSPTIEDIIDEEFL